MYTVIKKTLVGVLFLVFFCISGTAAQAADRYWVGGSDGANTSDAANWATSAGGCGVGGGASVPSTSDTAIFSSSCTNGATINANLSVYGLSIEAGYTGTITQGSGVTLSTGAGHFSQASGTFLGSDAAITHSNDFILSGGTFRSTSGTMSFSEDFTVSGGSFNHNSGNVTVNGTIPAVDINCNNIDFNTFTIDKSAHSITIASDCTLPIAGTNPTIRVGTNDGITNNGTIQVTGNLTITARQYIQNAGATLHVTGTTITPSSSLIFNGGSLTGSVTTIYPHGELNNSGNVLPDGLILSIVGSGTVNLICGDASFSSVEINKSANGLTIGSDCVLPISGTNPTIGVGTNDSIVNNGTLQITGNPTFRARNYYFNSSGTISSTGDTATFTRSLILQSGTWPGNITTLIVGSDLNNNANVLANGIDLTLNGGDWSTFNCGNAVFDSITISKTNGRLTPASNCSTGDLTFSATGGTDFYNPSSPYTWNITGNLTNSGSVDFGAADLTLKFNGTGTQTLTNQSSSSFDSPIVINKASGTLQLADTVTLSAGSCTVEEGTFFLDGNDLSCPAGITAEDGSTIKLIGDEIIIGEDTLEAGSLVEFIGDGDGLADTYQITDWDYSELTINFTDSNDSVTPSLDIDLSNSLQGHWQMNEASGTDFADSSGNNNTGTATAGVERATGYSGSGYALNFDGTSGDYATIPNSDSLTFGTPLTISSWVKTSVSGWKWIISRQDWMYGFGISNTGLLAWTVTGGNNRISSGNISDGNWHHVVATHDGTDLTLYVDGTAVGTWNNAAVSSSSSQIYLGRYANTNENWNGQIDEVRVYDRVLNSDEINVLADRLTETVSDVTISDNFNLLSGTFVSPASLTVSGDFNISGGTFTHNNSTLTLDGTNQTVSGSSTFYNLTKNSTVSDTLTFTSGTTQTISNALTLTGQASNLLSLRSSSSGNQWSIDPQGSRTIAYLDVQDSNNIDDTAMPSSGNNITDSGNNTNWGFNSAPSASTPTNFSQATDGSGYFTFETTISDPELDTTKLKVEYSDDGGSNWYDPVLTSVSPSSGTVDLDNSETYQLGSNNSIDTSTGNITLEITWDTQSASNGNGGMTNVSEDDIQIRVTPNDGTIDGTTSSSTDTDVDNQAPSSPGIISAILSQLQAITLSWSAVTEEAFSHFEIWFGTNKSDVESRSGTAQEWDSDNDSALATKSSTSTTITNLTDSTIYYFKIWATDIFGNESSSSNTLTGQTATPTPTPTPSSTPTPSPTPESTTCNKVKPSSAPDLFEVDQAPTSITIFFGPASGEVSKYVISYTKTDTPAKEVEIDGSNSGVHKYTFEDIATSSSYSIKVKAKNDCAEGPWSNTLTATTKSVATNTGIPDNSPNDNKKLLIEKVTKHSTKEDQQDSSKPEKSKEKEEVLPSYDVVIKVMDNGKPVVGATVEIHSEVKQAITDENGEAHFNGVEPGNHTVYLAYEGFEGSQPLEVSGPVKQQVVEMEVELVEQSPLQTWKLLAVIVVASTVVTATVVFFLFRKK